MIVTYPTSKYDTIPLEDFKSGSLEPWSASVLQALVRLTRPLRLLELGAFEGRTTLALAEVMPPEAHITAVEHDHKRAEIARVRLESHPRAEVIVSDTIRFLERAPRASFDFVFVDDDHAQEHVARELDLLLAGRMTPGGLIVGHDVLGKFELDKVFLARGGFIISQPLIHAGGGLGVIQA